MSYVVRADYNYASKYYLTATARYDGSSKFAKGHRWGLFPSFSAAWNIAEENFMKEHLFSFSLCNRLLITEQVHDYQEHENKNH